MKDHYFTLLLSVEDLPDPLQALFKATGLVGGLITVAVLTYEIMWKYLNDHMSIVDQAFFLLVKNISKPNVIAVNTVAIEIKRAIVSKTFERLNPPIIAFSGMFPCPLPFIWR